MAAIGVDFELEHDKAGYRVVPADPLPKGPRTSLLMGIKNHARIVRVGGELIRKRPLDRYPDLYTSFAKLPGDGESMAEWMTRFGPMLPAVHETDGLPVAVLRAEIANLRSLIEASQQKPAAFRHVTKEHGIHLRDMSAVLTVEQSDFRFVLSLRPKSLIGGMWIQFARDLTQGARLPVCRHCGRIFPAGPGTGRRLDAEFCSKEHQVAFNSLERTRRKQ